MTIIINENKSENKKQITKMRHKLTYTKCYGHKYTKYEMSRYNYGYMY